jgi:hypothetical protein
MDNKRKLGATSRKDSRRLSAPGSPLPLTRGTRVELAGSLLRGADIPESLAGKRALARLMRHRPPLSDGDMELLISRQPMPVRDAEDLKKLVCLRDEGKVKRIDQLLSRQAAEAKKYWKDAMGISRGRPGRTKVMEKFARWAYLKDQGLSLSRIAWRSCPKEMRKSDLRPVVRDRISHGIEAFRKYGERFLSSFPKK